jgi:hypothetical protein
MCVPRPPNLQCEEVELWVWRNLIHWSSQPNAGRPTIGGPRVAGSRPWPPHSRKSVRPDWSEIGKQRP